MIKFWEMYRSGGGKTIELRRTGGGGGGGGGTIIELWCLKAI